MIAVLDLDSYARGGAQSWVQAVLGALPDAEWLTIKRGRGTPMPRDPDKLAAALARFELIIVPDPVSYSVDKRAYERGEKPFYLQALEKVDTPVVTGIHSPWPNFYGKYPFFRASELIDRARGYWTYDTMPFPPYVRRLPNAWEPGRSVVITGRCSPVKGQLVIARLADQIGCDVTIAGKSEQFASKNLHGQLTKRFGITSGEVKTNHPWEIRTPKGWVIRYHGEYDDLAEVLAGHSVHLNLTDVPGFAAPGHLEYSTLEALDAGLRCIVPPRSLRPDYAVGDSLVPAVGYEDHAHYSAHDLVRVVGIAVERQSPPADTDANLSHHDAHRYVKQLVRLEDKPPIPGMKQEELIT